MAIVTLTYGSLNLTSSPYLLEFGADVGAPQNTVEALALLLQDGEVELSTRASNRTLQFNVLIEGATLAALATAEANLVAETEKPLNTISIDPGDSGPVTVHETFRGQVSLARDDDWENARLRRYVVTVKAAPFPRSASEVTVAALPASGVTTTLVDAGSATTGWTGTTDGVSATVAVVSGAVGVTTASLSTDTLISLTRTGSITTSSTKYLVIDYRPTTGGFVQSHLPTDLRVYGDGVELSRLSTVPVSSTTYRATFVVAASSIAALRLDLRVLAETGGGSAASGSQARTFHVDNINRTDIRPGLGSAKQQLRSLTLSGSAPALGSMSIQHATNALGDALVYVWTNPNTGGGLYVPALRPYRSAGGTVTADATMVSGSRESWSGGAANTITLDIPHATLPTGKYLLMVRAAAASGSFTSTVGWSAQTRIGSTGLNTALTGSRSFAATTTYGVFPIGTMVLPATDVRDGTVASLRLILSNNSGSSNDMTWDEAWLFNLSLGDVVQVACGTGAAASGGPSKRLFIDPPKTTRPRPTVLQGNAADGSDAYCSGVQAWGMLRFDPPTTNVFTVTTNTVDADVALRYFPRWHTNAAS